MQLLLNYSDELAGVKDAFHYTRDTPVLPKNAARHSGAIKWVRGLVERIEAPMDKIRALNKLVLETEEARRTLEDHTALVQAMKEFEEEHVKAWVSQVSQVGRPHYLHHIRYVRVSCTSLPPVRYHTGVVFEKQCICVSFLYGE